ncbi:MAG: hypothetical protein ABSG84_10080 [Acidobacteriaceae bacterium]
MATFVAPVESQVASAQFVCAGRKRERGFAVLLVSALTLFALAVHGYHPYAEDGGLYVAGVKWQLDPALYPHGTAFVLEPMRFSLFASLVAALVRLTRFSLPAVLLVIHVASVWATLFAAWMLATRCWAQRAARAGAVVLLSCWLTLPVAGTALFLMDPYVTARSLSTPCTLLALVGALDFTGRGANLATRRRGLCLWTGGIALAAVMHPLMAAYALWATLMLVCVRSSWRTTRVWAPVGLSAATLAVAACLQHMAKPENVDSIRAALTRTYWFPALWAWYELVGLVAPLVILLAFAWASRKPPQQGSAPENSARQALARMAVAVGVTAFLVAALLARAAAAAHLVARMQPLRVFQIVYLVMVLALGAKLGEWVLRRSLWRWVAAMVLLGGVMLAAQRAAFPNSNHLELPWTTPRNPWVQAFLWIRGSTPRDALFALDANYINAPGEDAQSFRAIAERSALPDYSKDGGEASIAPELAQAWTIGQAAQQGLSSRQEIDAQRVAALSPLGVSWVVLESGAATGFDCPYRNEAVKVCRLR